MDVNIENEEMQDGTDVGTGLVVDQAEEIPSVGSEGMGPVAEEVTEAEGEASLDQGELVADVVTTAATKSAYDYTDVVYSEYTDIDCETGTKTDHFTQVTVGIKVNDDGTTEAVDLGNTPEVYADEFPATADELSGAGCAPTQEAVAQVETVASAPVQQPEVLAETGLSGAAVPAALGAIILIVIGGMLVMNGISKRIGRKNK